MPPLRNTDVCIKSYGNPSKNCSDISVQTVPSIEPCGKANIFWWPLAVVLWSADFIPISWHENSITIWHQLGKDVRPNWTFTAGPLTQEPLKQTPSFCSHFTWITLWTTHSTLSRRIWIKALCLLAEACRSNIRLAFLSWPLLPGTMLKYSC